MPTEHRPRHRPQRHPAPAPKHDLTSVLLIPPQDREGIRRRQELRDALHDAKAVTIKGRTK